MQRARGWGHVAPSTALVIGSVLLVGCGTTQAQISNSHVAVPTSSTATPDVHCEYRTTNVPNVIGLRLDEAEINISISCLSYLVSSACHTGDVAKALVTQQSLPAGAITSTHNTVELAVCT
jgi:beta-lactam-binding protein with PASTA domain